MLVGAKAVAAGLTTARGRNAADNFIFSRLQFQFQLKDERVLLRSNFVSELCQSVQWVSEASRGEIRLLVPVNE